MRNQRGAQVNDQHLYKVCEVAELCRVHLNTVRRWIKAGHIRVIRLPGRGVRISAEEVERLRQPVGADR